ncbi:MAG: cytochrome c [Leptolyngbyaceae cyanobacterium SM1_1_3]|nr:cytochrome c [Leptolyngbyaceae cyanobacterium SM1_1_3]NJN03991.1 cytochrome c [Leptolyngbyaceae cyanobacterium RM1_1_2]NJO11011.1 cytochrome c [Leptolyngbyaceae cyanobacterium SL_1_1]
MAAVGLVLALGLIAWGVQYFRVSDPYILQVLALPGDRDRGALIFQMNCAVCHGFEAAGEVGPDLHGVSERKSKVNLIRQVTSGQTPPMPQFQPKAKDMADLLEYLESL